MLSLKETLSRVFGRSVDLVRSRGVVGRVRSPRPPRRPLRMEWLEERILLCNPGELDLTFGSGGIAVTDINGGNNIGTAVAVQTDGKTVAAGSATESFVGNSNSIFALARYNADGSLDTTFDGDGKVTTFHATQQRNGSLTGTSGTANAVAVQSDGKIITAGSSMTYSGKKGQLPVNNGFTLVRYNSNGSLDTSFGNQGIVTTTAGGLGGGAVGYGLVLQTDGKIVVAGSGGGGVGLARFNSNGTLDTSFSGDGVVTTNLGSSSARAVALQSDGSIVVTGPKDYVNPGTSGAFVARYTSTGNLDSSFGTSGVASITVAPFSYLRSVAIQTDGRIVAVGNTNNGDGNNDQLVVRLDTSGILDSTFDGDGIFTLSVVANDSESAKGVAVQANGQIVVAGYAIANPGGASAISLVRLNVNGSLDATFGTGGVVVAGSNNGANSVALQADGKIVTVGGANGVDFGVARFCA